MNLQDLTTGIKEYIPCAIQNFGRFVNNYNIINTNKWEWDGQLEFAISKNMFVKRIVKTATKHNNILLKYAIKQSLLLYNYFEK